MTVSIYVDGRHPKDILRSFAHELVHHAQNENGELDMGGYSGAGYAQKNKDLRNMERDAYERGNMCFRDWEDQLKQQKPTIYNERRIYKMSTKKWKNKELSNNLSEKFGFRMDLTRLNEGKGWGKDPADFTGTKEEEDEAAEDLKTGKLAEEQGYDDKENERLAAKDGKESGKEQTYKDRRDDAGFEVRGENLKEDSDDAAWHEWKNEHADDDHIKEIEHHLRALKDDRDYEKKGAEDDHDKEEDEGYDRRDESKRRRRKVTKRPARKLSKRRK